MRPRYFGQAPNPEEVLKMQIIGPGESPAAYLAALNASKQPAQVSGKRQSSSKGRTNPNWRSRRRGEFRQQQDPTLIYVLVGMFLITFALILQKS